MKGRESTRLRVVQPGERRAARTGPVAARRSGTGLRVALLVATGALIWLGAAYSARAALIWTSPQATIDDSSGSYVATVTYIDDNLSNDYWQLTSPSPTVFSDWALRRAADAGFTSFDPGFGSGGTPTAGTVFDVSTGNNFQLRVTLPDPEDYTVGAIIGFQLRTNADGTLSGALLSDTDPFSSSVLSRGFRVEDDGQPPDPVPEPPALTLLLAGLTGLLFRRRREPKA